MSVKKDLYFWQIACKWLVYVLLLFISFLLFRDIDLFKSLPYTNWGINEWLINYEGGFVRRGLDGQILYWIYNLHPFDVVIVIRCIIAITSFSLLYLLLSIFRKEGWSLFILILSCCLFYLIFQVLGRRDAMLLLCVYGLFSSYKNYVFKTRKWLWGSLFVLLSVFILLSHEAFFFCSLPLIGVYALSFVYNKDVKQEGLRTYIRLFAPFIPALVTFLAVIYYKGNAEMAKEIWASWTPLFRTYPDSELTFNELVHTIGDNVNALSWDTVRTMKIHFLINTTGVDSGFLLNSEPIPSFRPNVYTLLFLWIFVSTYFLVTHLNTFKIGWWKLSDTEQVSRISQVLLVQFVFMLPMFTILSCDYGRTFPYWTLSSLFALHVFGDLRLPLVTNISQKVERLFPQNLRYSKIFFFICFFLYPFWMYRPEYETILFVRFLLKGSSFLQHVAVYFS